MVATKAVLRRHRLLQQVRGDRAGPQPALREVHVLKTASRAVTISSPAQVIVRLALRPKVCVASVLALVAALVQLASVIALVSS